MSDGWPWNKNAAYYVFCLLIIGMAVIGKDVPAAILGLACCLMCATSQICTTIKGSK